MPAFRDLLRNVAETYRERRNAVDDAANQLLRALDQRLTGTADALPGARTVAGAARQLLKNADRIQGGFGGAPKFPTPTYLELLLAAADALPADEAKDAVSHVALTCRAMARGGVYDHVGGAFHRYAVDAEWGIPHFEKMLYDQGQLLRVYAETWRRTGRGDEALLWPIRETVEFMRREMTAPDGGFYASLDADSEGVEGKYYAWNPDEIATVLGEERAIAFNVAYGVTPVGNFEGGATVLREQTDEPRNRFAEERMALRTAREARIAPGTDCKRVAAWNGLAISGLARAGSLLGDEGMLREASGAADFVLEKMIGDDGHLLRTFDEGQARVSAFLDDLAAMLEACLDLQRAGAGERFLSAAFGFADDIATRFYDANETDLFLTPSDGERLVHRPRSDHDGATPHSAGLAALGLVRAATIGGRSDLRDLVESVFQTHAFALERSPAAYPTLARAALAAERGLTVAVIVGDPEDPAARNLAECARRTLRPEDAVIVTRPDTPPADVDPHWLRGREPVDGRPTAYVCRGVECSLPALSASELEPLC